MLAKIFYLCYYNFRDDVCMENIIDSGIYVAYKFHMLKH